jgi:nucleoside-diphosphate-sugar epimerase
MIYLLGIGSFIGQNFYLKLKKLKDPVLCLSRNEIDKLKIVKNSDIIVNFCGINRGKNESDYENGNYVFITKIIELLNINNSNPYLIHISSFMVNGFIGKQTNDLPEYQRYFIDSKLKAENYLINNYPIDQLCILRPSNIYGHNCEPYSNNILVTLIFEKITKNYKTNNINKNCIRNFLSVDGLCSELVKLTQTKKSGIYNIISNNNIDLQSLTKILYKNDIPPEINIIDGDLSQPSHTDYKSETIIINEIFVDLIELTEKKMLDLKKINESIIIKKLNRLSQPRGDMVEISDLHGQRSYMITLNQHSIRGNHFHFKQIEHFYMHRGKAIYLLSHTDQPDLILLKILDRDDSITIKPPIIHTLVNDFISNECEVSVVSTQPFVPNQTPDTEYIQIIPY